MNKISDIITGNNVYSRNQLLEIEQEYALNNEEISKYIVYYRYEKSFLVKAPFNKYQVYFNFVGSPRTTIRLVLDDIVFMSFTTREKELIKTETGIFKFGQRDTIFKIRVEDYTGTNFLLEYNIVFSK